MALRPIPNSQDQYFLICYDAQGNERQEADGTYLTERLLRDIRVRVPSDVFFLSHGWRGDIPAAIAQYDQWLGTVSSAADDIAGARLAQPGFAPLVIGLHWPSQPWGDEDTQAGGLLSVAWNAADIDARVDDYAGRIADTPAAREAIRSILVRAESGQHGDAPGLLNDIKGAYARLFAQAGLQMNSAQMMPGAEQEDFSIESILAASPALTPSQPDTGLLGAGENFKDLVLSPLRQLSFWKMKERARRFGEGASHDLLKRLQEAVPRARFHLMGHSFGSIVASSTVMGPAGSRGLSRPVESLFLVQGALSLWCYAGVIPYSAGNSGFYRDILTENRVNGPIITTRSRFDAAVGRFYPLGAQLATQYLLDVEYPKYGAIGAFGIQGAEVPVHDLLISGDREAYSFAPGSIYNVEASSVIKNGVGLSGAHNDIAHPEIAHVFWSGVLQSLTTQGAGAAPGSGGFLSGGTFNPPKAWEPAGPPALTGGNPRYTDEETPLDESLFASVNNFSDDADSGGPGMLDAESLPRGSPVVADRPPPAGAPAAESEPPAVAETWLHHEVEDIAAETPLEVSKWYTLAFSLDPERPRDASLGARPVDLRELVMGEYATLRLQLESTAFAIANQVLPIKLYRDGYSREKARFGVSPRIEGPGIIVATLHKDGNFVTRLSLTCQVGRKESDTPTVSSTQAGPAATPATVRDSRDLSLVISPAGVQYDCIVSGAVASRARLTCSRELITSAAERTKDALLKLITTPSAAKGLVFQRGIDIDPDSAQLALVTLANSGVALFRELFFGPAAGADSLVLGEYLRRQATDPTAELKLQIVAQELPIPWSLLYLGDVGPQANLTWDLFLGKRHIIEQIPLQTGLYVAEPTISSAALRVSANVNDEIDVRMGVPLVGAQLDFWMKISGRYPAISFICRNTGATFLGAILDEGNADQLIYLYCHAKAADLKAGLDSSALQFGDGEVTLGQLSARGLQKPFKGAPLILINACESADLSPLFYEGFVPFFASRGARGVIGTECKVPAVFAADWAARFFNALLKGKNVGEITRDLRKRYLSESRNPLAFLYAVHCNADTRLRPAVVC